MKLAIRNSVFVITVVAFAALGASPSVFADTDSRPFSNADLRGTWTIAGWLEATLLVPFPGEITHSTPPSVPISPGDKITIKGTLVGLFEFDGNGNIKAFKDLFKAGGVEPLSPPFPLPFIPPFPESGYGTYSVDSSGMVKLQTLIINPADDGLAGEADYDCVLNRKPKQLDCIFSRFRTYVVDPAGYHAPIVGQFTMRPRR
jgi:hypothetical protein